MKRLIISLVALALLSPAFGMGSVPDDFTLSPQLPGPITIPRHHVEPQVHPKPHSHPRPLGIPSLLPLPELPKLPEWHSCPELPLVPEVRHVYPEPLQAPEEHWDIQWASIAADGTVGIALIIILIFGIRRWKARKGTKA